MLATPTNRFQGQSPYGDCPYSHAAAVPGFARDGSQSFIAMPKVAKSSWLRRSRSRTSRLSPVALLELLARAAPEGVIAPDLLAVGDRPGRGRDRAAAREKPARRHRRAASGAVGDSRGSNRLRARNLSVLAREPCGV